MIGIDWAAIAALLTSVLVAVNQITKEWRERRSASTKEKIELQKADDEQTMVPIRGANEAVIALGSALKIAQENENRLRSRIVHLETENDRKDDIIDELQRRVQKCEMKLDQLENKELK